MTHFGIIRIITGKHIGGSMLPLVAMETAEETWLLTQRGKKQKGHAFNILLVRREHSSKEVSTIMEHIGLKPSLSPYVLVWDVCIVCQTDNSYLASLSRLQRIQIHSSLLFSCHLGNSHIPRASASSISFSHFHRPTNLEEYPQPHLMESIPKHQSITPRQVNAPEMWRLNIEPGAYGHGCPSPVSRKHSTEEWACGWPSWGNLSGVYTNHSQLNKRSQTNPHRASERRQNWDWKYSY